MGGQYKMDETNFQSAKWCGMCYERIFSCVLTFLDDLVSIVYATNLSLPCILSAQKISGSVFAPLSSHIFLFRDVMTAEMLKGEMKIGHESPLIQTEKYHHDLPARKC